MDSTSMQWGSNGVGELASAFLINKQTVLNMLTLYGLSRRWVVKRTFYYYLIMLIKCQQTNRVHACVTHTELSVYTRIATCSRLTQRII